MQEAFLLDKMDDDSPKPVLIGKSVANQASLHRCIIFISIGFFEQVRLLYCYSKYSILCNCGLLLQSICFMNQVIRGGIDRGRDRPENFDGHMIVF